MESFPMTDINDILRLANCNQEEELMEVSDRFDIEFDDQLVIETGIVGFTEDGVIVEGDDKLLELLNTQDALLESTDLSVDYVPDPGLSGNIQDLLELLSEQEFIPRPAAGPSFRPKVPSAADIRDIEDWRIRRKQIYDILYGKSRATDPETIRAAQTVWAALRDIGNEKFDMALPEGEMSEAMIMGNSNEPCEENMSEAEYQGRKVQLNKPMAGDVKKSKVYVKKPNGKVVKVNFGDKNMRIKKSNPNRRKSFRARHRCDNPGPKWKARYWSCRAW